ncbi:flagellar hook-length control protein FliK [Superficieibacter sp. HKU1]|uniref:flagellar hook-length control protein FliK n=1 Tax=Superficieibacter sp. HKU1 TaxID=3031919 RepID=UPI0023E0B42C|nr:flagellar hook-length control protein FliK [Superficieibacter sp. HKU1]WES66653.1 flagellar hook-length control protein FliK [Superficieibacter sp. HKU1]
MITLPDISVSDANVTSGGLSAKSTDGAQDFLALLAGALGGDKAPATLAEVADSRPVAQNARKSGLTLDDLHASMEDETLTDLSDIRLLLSGLTADQKSVVKSDAAENDLPPADVHEDDLTDLSALMAMLPPPSTPAPTQPAAREATPALASSVPLKGNVSGDKASSLKEAIADGPSRPQTTAINTQPFTAAQSNAAVRVETESTPSPVATSSNVAPVISPTMTPAPAHAAAIATVSAPLGSPDWQQTVSQHVTLFTRQGQQTAELRLHPEDLGQVQITLKMDDNQAQLQMVSPHSHVRAALEAALPMLRTQLAESGIQLGQSSISSESFAGQQQSSSQQQSARHSPTGGQLDAQDDELLNVPASLQSRSRGESAVDIFA